ncbi:MAG: TonB-dependent receptor [Cytophagales bacterium]|nr:MAG: TonB-dependent receptor [Cytophagales bacterium]TAF62146.1 MAG: TonB-dependent receptor [Cytophagales bacterium]
MFKYSSVVLFCSFLLCFTGISVKIQAQDQWTISGSAVEQSSKKGIELMTIALFSSKDSIYKANTSSREDGSFVFEKIAAGNYYLIFQLVGYKSKKVSNIDLRADLNLGEVIIEEASQKLDEVTVSTRRSDIEYQAEKKVINVSKNLVSAGGTAVDVLKNVSSMTEDVDGNLTLRGGSGMNILINGKPTGLGGGGNRMAILNQIPASQIETIEIITNPSAKYDAEGSTGTINIVLKKNADEGWNGMLSGNVGTRDKYTTSLQLNYKKKAFNNFFSYDYRKDPRYNRGTIYRRTYFGGDTVVLDQQNDGNRNNLSHNFRLGTDVSISKRATLSVSGQLRINLDDSDEITNYLETNNIGIFKNRYRQSGLADKDGQNYEGSIFYRQLFKQKGQYLNVDFNYSQNTNLEDGVYRWNYFDQLFNPNLDSVERRQNLINDDKVRLITTQADFSRPLNAKTKIELGAKAIIRRIDSDFQFLNGINEEWTLNPLASNRFVFDENVLSLYATYSGDLQGFKYQIGLRAEQTLTTSNQKTTDLSYVNNYLNFFPSAFITRKLDDKNSLQLSYSRRINRPGVGQLNPFVDYTDPLNVRFGNPKLNPEFTNAFEMGYIRNTQAFTFNATAFYRPTNNLIFRFQQPFDTGILAVTFKNFALSTSYGLEFAINGDLAKWWKLNADWSYFRTVIDAGNVEAGLNNSNYSWTFKLNSSFTLPGKLVVQLIGNYTAPRPTAQGRISSIYFMEIGARKDILKGRANVNMRLSDMFDTQQFSVLAQTPSFDRDFMRKRETRILFLGFTYKLKNNFKSKEPRRNPDAGSFDGGY